MSFKSIKLRDLFKNRWVVFAASSWLESCSGMGYMYGQYSQLFKTTLGYNQKLVDGIGMAKDLGGNVGITSGFCGDYFPSWVVLLIGSFQNFFGYFTIWLVISGKISTPPFWLMCIIICIGANGATFFNTAGLVTCVKIFPYSRGPVVGLLKGYIGLSGAIFTQIYLALYYPNSESILFMVSWLPSLVSILIIPAIHPVTQTKDEDEQKQFKFVLMTAICLALTLLGTNLLEQMMNVNRYFSLFISILVFFILGIPIGIAVMQESEETRNTVNRNTGSHDSSPYKEPVTVSASKHAVNERLRLSKRPKSVNTNGNERNEREVEKERLLTGEGRLSSPSPLLSSSSPSPSVQNFQIEENLIKVRHGQSSSSSLSPSKESFRASKMDENENGNRNLAMPKRGEDHTLLQAIRTKDFWLVYLAMTLASGSGLTAINNLGQIGNSLGYNESAINVLVSVMSIWNFFGRVLGGYLGEHFVLNLGYPRPMLMVLSQLIMTAGHVLFAWAFPGSLYLASMLVGLNYGAQWGLMPAVASEIFGLRYFSTMYNWLTIANPTGSYILSVCVAGYLYDYEAAKQVDLGSEIGATASGLGSEPTLLCTGAVCFRLTFIVMAFACIIASGLSMWLTLLTRPYYSAEFMKRHSPERDDCDDESGACERVHSVDLD